MLLNIILIFCAGFTFAVGGLNIIIGLSYQRDRSYLFFGLLSIFASIFLLEQISFVSNQLATDYSGTISILSAGIFYSLFVWFIGEFTGFRNSRLQWLITLALVLVVVFYFFASSSELPWGLWEALAHLTILCISIYGFYAGVQGLKFVSKVWKIIYLISMISLFVLTVIVGLSLSINFDLILDPEGYPSLLDFFPVFFSILIGSKMSHDVVRSYQLEREVKQKDQEWSTLMESINLLVVRLGLHGKISYINSHLRMFTGYEADDLIGKDWFELVLALEEKGMNKENFLSLMQRGDIPDFHNQIKTKNGGLKSIQWSNMPLYDNVGNVAGALSIGADVTERESALAEIKLLKDQLEMENLLLKEEVKWNEYASEIIGESDALMYVMKRANQVTSTNSSVLLEGETGVGKELFANMIHRNSPRKHKSFIKVNCASLPKELIESELFGHEKGAFTGAIRTRQGRFELADKGTIFLDEIGELPIDLQPKLLRVLQTGEFERIGSEQTKRLDVRVIAATNRNLQEESENGSFRQDLFFRLSVYPITIPPLRQRKEDIPVLIKHFTAKIGRKIGRKIKHISKADIKKLQAYDWPGNVRELENVLERAIISSESETIKLDESQLKPSFSHQKADKSQSGEVATLSDSQKKHIVNILNECNWKINGDDGAAQKLGMPPSTLRSKMKKLNIERPETK